MKKYVLMPGFIRSKNDGDEHYIGAPQLARLYGVPLDECEIFSEEQRGSPRFLGLIRLKPRYDGNYKLPGSK